MEGKLRRFPLSLSLQDLRTISAPADLEAASSLDCFQEDPRGTASKSLGFSLPVYHRPVRWRVAAGLLVLSLVLLLLFLGFLWGRSLWSQEEPIKFAIVMDCGSTSTRVYVYGWVHNGGSIPVMYRPPSHSSDNARVKKAYHRMETEPGFHQLLHNESGLGAAVQPLLDWAKQQIPARLHGETPLLLLGTAGLRKLATVDSEWLLDKAWGIIEKSPFKCRRSWLRIINGVEEAYYGWVALNYILERLGQDETKMTLGTVGSLDLGGSSLEVTFEPGEPIRPDYGVNLSFGQEEHRVYAYSHSGFGLNDAFDKSVALLMHNSNVRNGTLEVRHPCLHSEYQQSYSCSSYCVAPPSTNRGAGEGGVPIVLVGEPHWGKCQALARSVINSSRFTTRSVDCEQSNCALGKYQPRPIGQFYAVAGFFVMYKFFGLSSKASLDDLLSKGQEFCGKPWPVARDSVDPQGFIDRYCFRAPYVVALLREGLHLRDEQVTVGPGDVTWTQGAALLEAGVLEKSSRSHRRQRWWFYSPSFLLPTLLLFSAAAVLVVLLHWCGRQASYSSILPFDSKPGAANGGGSRGVSRWPLNFVRRGVKSPQSPAPTPSKNIFEDPRASSPLLLEGDALRLPPAGPGLGRAQHLASAMMQLKVGSRLQSRRTLSKEDLNNL
ncbi:hypothetical protein SELMODRAFT_443766 [Selaginella moellendorffii]|uniref:Uncharacterized protein n=1 Tax=Selaginella moellendorffii TaxID=88036 RepID=D8S474_SELML|nr:probable apyrase 7 [Selaginella moellendorffii]XP_024538880.1 probable apyrase 7 [Selaginella moellendorffii]EFJ20885.1 hypothetical protein SELMODRAFT_443766 [Selaginella moellendorffii]|eukprot:XP_002978228.1 probable apyrase 7 [Selaginella moellendorffii]